MGRKMCKKTQCRESERTDIEETDVPTRNLRCDSTAAEICGTGAGICVLCFDVTIRRQEDMNLLFCSLVQSCCGTAKRGGATVLKHLYDFIPHLPLGYAARNLHKLHLSLKKPACGQHLTVRLAFSLCGGRAVKC